MCKMRFNVMIECPWCERGKSYADGYAKLRTSHLCDKCGKPYIIDWYRHTSQRATAIKTQGRNR